MPVDALQWAFHRGFSGYVARLPDGRVEAVEGAEVLEDGTFRFPASHDAVTDTGPERPRSHRFTGAVRFTGHHGMMAVTLSAPALEPPPPGAGAGAGSPWALIDDPFAPGERMTLAGLAIPSGADVGQTSAAPQLTEEGSDLFLGTYPPGTPLEPLTLIDPTDGSVPGAPEAARADQEDFR